MPALTKLPPEILSEIFEYLACDVEGLRGDEGATTSRQVLCALARTCRSLSGPAIDALYARLAFEFTSHDHGDSRDFRRLTGLLARLRERPVLIDRIKSCELIWRSSSWHHKTETGGGTGIAYHEFVDCLSRSATLIRLSLCLGSRQSIPILVHLSPRTESRGGFPALKTLEVELSDEINKCFLPADYIVLMSELPRLATLALQMPVGNWAMGPYVSARSPAEPPGPHLKELYLGSSRPVSAQMLEVLLLCAPGIEQLQLLLPGDAQIVSRRMSAGLSVMGYDLLAPLRPARLGTLLAPVASTLTHLQLEATNVRFPSHDGSQIDLSAFRSLRHLVISSSLLFGDTLIATHYFGPGTGLYPSPLWRILPPHLDVLEIEFDGRQGVFWCLPEMRIASQQPEGPSNFAQAQWMHRHDDFYVDWLIDLLAAASGREKGSGKEGGVADENPAFTLNYVFIVEAEIVDRDQDYQIVKWEKKTDRLNSLAASAGVALEIQLRVPRNFQSEECEVIRRAWEYLEDCFGDDEGNDENSWVDEDDDREEDEDEDA